MIRNSLLVFSMLLVVFSGRVCGKEPGLKSNETLVFFGDSITRFGADSGGYVSLVSDAVAAVFPQKNIQVIGAGIGGNKVPDLLARVDRDVLSQAPTAVMIFIGINDVWHWTKPHPVTGAKREGTTPELYEAGLRELVNKIQSAQARVILCTPTVIGEIVDPDSPDFQRLDAYAAIVRMVARDTGAQLLDLRQVFVEYLSKYNREQLKQGVLTRDGVHLNTIGNQLVAQQVCDLLGISYSVSSESLVSGSVQSMDLYLLIGQSNMAGRAPIPQEVQEALDQVFLLNEQAEWSPARHPFNSYSTIRKDLNMQKLGPAYSFAQQMRSINPGVPLGLIVNARGGSSIRSWGRGGHYYTSTVNRVKVAQQTGILRGILWHQGETDYQDEDYLLKLTQLIADLRMDLGDPKLPFIVGQINGIPLINNQLAALPYAVPMTACVSSEGLIAQDRWHFNTESQFELGLRYAEALLGLSAQGGSN
ncbi:sialate O-acetylesterase [Coraliomargarita sp. SDUM461004]|uniref:Sialate O-acetylesterase n=1 Tax=Thalassobacterium sedimentorum TaxID=3041258 RepID=A0ABU1ALF1_9BACT|nr:sialate O-acetylesterase [Coraliomargarita sp. SDUM461004]MDQ8195620.1 sialate O-acetylesterase [Coraliomargarita sp. SDUM461004]